MKHALFLIILIFLAACTATEPALETSSANDDVSMNEGVDEPATAPLSNWMEIELTDVNSGDTYTISQFDGPVFVESFAVWCPTCTRQQIEFKKFHETNPDIVTVTLDTDPNENAQLVKEHAESYGFDWRFSVSPAELTQGLIDEFGLGVVNAPAVPVILICPGKEPELLGRGIKDQADINAAVASCEAA